MSGCELLSEHIHVESLHRRPDDEIASSLISEPVATMATLSNTMLSKEDRNSTFQVGEYIVGMDHKDKEEGVSSLTIPILKNVRRGKRHEQAMPARSPLKVHNALSQL